MARPKAFDPDDALCSAIGVFCNHGFEGARTDALVKAMRIGRQSLYDSFGDKWQLYLAALRHYVSNRVQQQLVTLRAHPRAIDGIADLLETIIDEAGSGCMGIGSICEFGRTCPEVTAINAQAGITLRRGLAARIVEAQANNDANAALDPDVVAGFIVMNLVGMKVAGRSGASAGELRGMARTALRSLQ